MVDSSTVDTKRPERRGGPAPLWRTPWLIALVVLVIAFMVYALPPYLTLDPNQAAVTLHPDYPPHYPFLVVHIFTGTVTFLTACLQLWPWLRRKHPAVHRVSGRLYVFLGVLPSALLAIAIVPWAFDGQPAGAIGNTLSGALWLGTTFAGFAAARRRRFAEHRRWMIYSFALALHIVWGRVFGLMAEHFPWFAVDGQIIKEWSGWFGVAFNLAVAWWLLNRKRVRARSKVVSAA
ncbi:DUF2306 domain-containing protein [Kibdelosporangium phytohabitans]|uniref:DUF2306 domain-containing protein n=1 Tax=Kibdelosporangium phytohabitans TaxID=860235 RepID=UPI000AADC853|nr:DUF2306 domain-containing protein [Kibdelosporangium phytohabitans]MBE1469410.1 hypothetical protein [Kibdelosporangium phytohabitans]